MILYENSINSSFDAVDTTVTEILKLIRNQLPMVNAHIRFKINFMLREILNNAAEHGNHLDLNKKIDIKVSLIHEGLKFEVRDEGDGFKLNPDFHIKNNLRERQRGYETLSEMAFKIEVDHNCVKVTFDLNMEVL
ncbi:ATP-binding protein [Fusibacter ferrireducens]|uniref:ATP-binding protein n=1 Tax=Fusibacter ferrireducens TaxID=2785058 RepID=A0ABR9ZY52_9FIRM|nr:ATP-binding protein [Fusibacter ferrireducens]MBF4695397.1 ATP-binding protein [Fusibacter ferrireducens]